MSQDLLDLVGEVGKVRVIVQSTSSLGWSEDEALAISENFSEPIALQKGAGNEFQYRGVVSIGPDQRRISKDLDVKQLEGAADILPKVRFYPKLGLAVGIVDTDGLKKVLQSNMIVRAEEAPLITAIEPEMETISQDRQGISQSIQALNVPELWRLGLTGDGIELGHLDSGVDAEHPDLEAALGEYVVFNENGDLRNPKKYYDSDHKLGHGTHTAGIIAGRNNGDLAYGVAPAAKINSAVVIRGGDELARVLGGLEWLLGTNIKIVNGSIGLTGDSHSFDTIMYRVRKADILPVFSIGNEGTGTSKSPANSVYSLSVGACSLDSKVLPGSSSEHFAELPPRLVPSIVAPGYRVVSANAGGGLRSLSGTSQAAPHIAGICALLYHAMPSATADEIEGAILFSAENSSVRPVGRSAHGMPDALLALNYLRGATMV